MRKILESHEDGYSFCKTSKNGTKFWFKNCQLHREGGPAIEWHDGDKDWFISGVQLSEEEFNKWLANQI